MKQITKYEAIDNTVFDTKKDCKKYEILIYNVNLAMDVLDIVVEDQKSSFLNGEGFIQHDIEDVNSVRNNLIVLTPLALKREPIGLDFLLRTLEGYKPFKPLYLALARVDRIDKSGREFGQKYYTNNPVPNCPQFNK